MCTLCVVFISVERINTPDILSFILHRQDFGIPIFTSQNIENTPTKVRYAIFAFHVGNFMPDKTFYTGTAWGAWDKYQVFCKYRHHCAIEIDFPIPEPGCFFVNFRQYIAIYRRHRCLNRRHCNLLPVAGNGESMKTMRGKNSSALEMIEASKPATKIEERI